jgi:hypothetical protein
MKQMVDMALVPLAPCIPCHHRLDTTADVHTVYPIPRPDFHKTKAGHQTFIYPSGLDSGSTKAGHKVILGVWHQKHFTLPLNMKDVGFTWAHKYQAMDVECSGNANERLRH